MAISTPGNDTEIENKIKQDFVNQSLQTGRYKVGAIEYPDGLRTKPDLQNYVAFFINSRDKSGKKNNEQKQRYLVSEKEQAQIIIKLSRKLEEWCHNSASPCFEWRSNWLF